MSQQFQIIRDKKDITKKVTKSCLNRALEWKRKGGKEKEKKRKEKKERKMKGDRLFVCLGGKWKEDKGNEKDEIFVF